MGKAPERSFTDEAKEPVINRVFQLVDRYPSRSQAARAWGMNVSTLQNYYKRKDIAPTPRKAHLLKIAEQEGVSLEWLLTGQGKPLLQENKKSEMNDFADNQITKPASKTNASKVDEKILEMLSFLSLDEKEKIVEVLVRKGVEIVLYLIDDNNIKLLQLPDEEKERLMALHEAKKGAFEDNQDNELSRPTHKAG
ncbi:helix-turn-helix domain-containing protein [Serratia fonticola]|uniref:helix-turn-helix domain-containing protein n=1 Tax=Serratia fonticola TaxID=47917 RepID=UPI0027F0EC1F|nr:helix-turn-helix domain-containing protein [Serratia fonticola]MDQ7212296.1 hypothetical protein [Serratia fonticola]HBE9082337.1 hypothetical protein [Serratia fonticola]HBE9093002.1 hypothetical protein [Serratia fonticola]HBE9155172.1 hypothetical protein [Serratia fonticola]